MQALDSMGHSVHRVLLIDQDVAWLDSAREAMLSWPMIQLVSSPDPEYGFELAIRERFHLFIFGGNMQPLRAALLYRLIDRVYCYGRSTRQSLPPIFLVTPDLARNDERELCDEPGWQGLLVRAAEPQALARRILKSLKIESTELF